MSFIVVLEDADPDTWRDNVVTLKVIHNGKIIREEYDGGEPEDNSFYRDWSWVESAIEEAYRLGCEDGKKSLSDLL